jgi:hypothetical protein
MVSCGEYGDEYSSFVEGRNSQYHLSVTSFSRNLGPGKDDRKEHVVIQIFLVTYWHVLCVTEVLEYCNITNTNCLI